MMKLYTPPIMEKFYVKPRLRDVAVRYESSLLYSGLKNMEDNSVFTEDLDDDE